MNIKIEAFIQRILRESEEEGLTISEVGKIPQELKFAITDSVNQQLNEIKFNRLIPKHQESSGNDDDNR